jgi:hypothetical protein
MTGAATCSSRFMRCPNWEKKESYLFKHLLLLLSRLFPPKMGKFGVYVESPEPDERGWAGNVREKRYRDGIDRVMQEGM